MPNDMSYIDVELYNRTIRRLSNMGLPTSAPTPDHIVMLAKEIEEYREQINAMKAHLEQIAVARDTAPSCAAELDVQRLKEAIVAQYLEKYAPRG